MGLLDGELAQSIYDGFKGKLLSGKFYQRVTPDSGSLNSLGDPVDLGYSDHDFEGFVDNFSAMVRSREGFPETDLKLCIFGKSMPGIVPKQADVATITGPAGSIYVGKWYSIRKQPIDPAGALWECQAFEIPKPQGIP